MNIWASDAAIMTKQAFDGSSVALTTYSSNNKDTVMVLGPIINTSLSVGLSLVPPPWSLVLQTIKDVVVLSATLAGIDSEFVSDLTGSNYAEASAIFYFEVVPDAEGVPPAVIHSTQTLKGENRANLTGDGSGAQRKVLEVGNDVRVTDNATRPCRTYRVYCTLQAYCGGNSNVFASSSALAESALGVLSLEQGVRVTW